MPAFEKTLSKNDTGQSGSHQAGILVPKGDLELLSFFPKLDATQKNPDAMIDCQDENGNWWRFRFIYYNNKMHDANGTRNEFRITRMTRYLRSVSAIEGQTLEFSAMGGGAYKIRLKTRPVEALGATRLTGWRRVH